MLYFLGEAQEECYKCGKQYLTSSNQLVGGYCRPCLGSSGSHKMALPHPSPRRSFSIESLATSSRKVSPSKSMTPLDMTSQAMMSQSLHQIPHPDTRGLSMGYSMLNHPSNMAGVSVHPTGSTLLHYSGGLPWPKLITPHYWQCKMDSLILLTWTFIKLDNPQSHSYLADCYYICM